MSVQPLPLLVFFFSSYTNFSPHLRKRRDALTPESDDTDNSTATGGGPPWRTNIENKRRETMAHTHTGAHTRNGRKRSRCIYIYDNSHYPISQESSFSRPGNMFFFFLLSSKQHLAPNMYKYIYTYTPPFSSCDPSALQSKLREYYVRVLALRRVPFPMSSTKDEAVPHAHQAARRSKQIAATKAPL